MFAVVQTIQCRSIHLLHLLLAQCSVEAGRAAALHAFDHVSERMHAHAHVSSMCDSMPALIVLSIHMDIQCVQQHAFTCVPECIYAH
eukprot:443484-Pelagomonas_calceolata.AAC.7